MVLNKRIFFYRYQEEILRHVALTPLTIVQKEVSFQCCTLIL